MKQQNMSKLKNKSYLINILIAIFILLLCFTFSLKISGTVPILKNLRVVSTHRKRGSCQLTVQANLIYDEKN